MYLFVDTNIIIWDVFSRKAYNILYETKYQITKTKPQPKQKLTVVDKYSQKAELISTEYKFIGILRPFIEPNFRQ